LRGIEKASTGGGMQKAHSISRKKAKFFLHFFGEFVNMSFGV